MAVIAVLVAVAIPTFTNQLEKSRQAVDVSNLRGAYAAARLAEIDQAVGNETFKDIVADDDNYPLGLQFWYDPDSGNLKRATKKDDTKKIVAYDAVSAVGGVASCGKAITTKVVADTSQLPGIAEEIIYNDGSVSTETTNSATGISDAVGGLQGTVNKAILVTFKTDPSSIGKFVIDKVGFATKVGAWSNATLNSKVKVYYVTGLPGTLNIGAGTATISTEGVAIAITPAAPSGTTFSKGKTLSTIEGPVQVAKDDGKVSIADGDIPAKGSEAGYFAVNVIDSRNYGGTYYGFIAAKTA